MADSFQTDTAVETAAFLIDCLDDTAYSFQADTAYFQTDFAAGFAADFAAGFAADFAAGFAAFQTDLLAEAADHLQVVHSAEAASQGIYSEQVV